ncbi:hypothetical protein O6H91_07G096600 [Diphasiastrum complanatum]|uniref:Uncharacterized protein n=1 Tax=Diphasiastrum complanatum TaxID=34168 RepID=A0ACC2D8A0_DIPCM|nr:hypothetical protein O6H91_07G096600 [Diphasiastrum complanatum]
MILFTSAMAEALILVPPSPSVHCTNVNASSNQAPNKIWALRIFSVGPFHKLKISKCAWRVKPFYMDLQQSCLAYASTSSNSEETFVDAS